MKIIGRTLIILTAALVVVGITFAIQGKLDDPNVLVNPISVVAPGIFRQIFEFRGEGQNAASSTTAPPSDLTTPR